ncbi:hypothetical protein DN536_34990, partial [Burkholderia multivorans]
LGKNVRHSPDVVRRMAEAGHEVGNHSFDHPQMSKKSPETVRRQVEDTDADIEAAGGGKPNLVRPPYGALTKATAKALGHPVEEPVLVVLLRGARLPRVDVGGDEGEHGVVAEAEVRL